MDFLFLLFVFVVLFIFSRRDERRNQQHYQQMNHYQAYNQYGQPVNPYQQAPYPPYGKAIGKWTYFLLVFFLGGLGIHKFIAGKWFQGLLYLAFCWTFVPSLFAFFHSIGVLFRKPDQFGNIYI